MKKKLIIVLSLVCIAQQASAETWVQENVKRGAIIILNTGHIFEVYRLDRIESALWLRLDTIVVARNPDPPLFGFNWILLNTDDNEAVSAKFLGRSNSASQEPRELNPVVSHSSH